MREKRMCKAALDGDPDALEVLVRKEYPAILRYCRWHLPDEQMAQDAAQETFLKAVRYLDGCADFQGAFRPFLYRIAHNVCIDQLGGFGPTPSRWKRSPSRPLTTKRGSP